MLRVFSLCLLLFFSYGALADCQDNCTGGEAVCVEDCSKTGFATLGCVTRCSREATKCARTCTPDPPPEPKPAPPPDPKKNPEATPDVWRAAFPLAQSTKFSVADCCEPGVPKLPMCAYIRCAPPPADMLAAKRNWSGKLFDTDVGAQPKSVCSLCESHPSPVCELIRCGNVLSPVPVMTPVDRAKYRQHLEALRRATDFARITNQITAKEQKQLLDAYRKDYYSVFGR